MIQVQTQELLRLHSDRIAVPCIADLFAISEADLPATLAAELRLFTQRASREFLDLPEGPARLDFIAELSEIPPNRIPQNLRSAIEAFAAGSSEAVTRAAEQLLESLQGVPPEAVTLPKPPAKRAASPAITQNREVDETPKKTPAKAPAKRSPRTPAAFVDPARAEWIRDDVMDRLKTREYADRGLKESVLIAGCRHRAGKIPNSPYKDLTEEEVRAELRRLEREQKVKHTGDRWIIR